MTVVMPLQVNQAEMLFSSIWRRLYLGCSRFVEIFHSAPFKMKRARRDGNMQMRIQIFADGTLGDKSFNPQNFSSCFQSGKKTGSTRLSIQFPIYPIFIPEKFKVKQFIRQWAFHVRVCSRVRKILKTDYLTQFPSSYLILQSFCGCGPEIPHFSSFETRIWKSGYFRQYQSYLKLKLFCRYNPEIFHCYESNFHLESYSSQMLSVQQFYFVHLQLLWKY